MNCKGTFHLSFSSTRCKLTEELGLKDKYIYTKFALNSVVLSFFNTCNMQQAAVQMFAHSSFVIMSLIVCAHILEATRGSNTT